MKKFILRFGIVLATAMIGITSTIVWLKYNPVVESYDKINFAEIPSVAYCDLKNNPRKYDGKIVRIQSAKLHWFMHGYFLADENCAGEGDSARTAISLYEIREGRLREKIKQIHPTNELSEATEVTLVGTFNYKNQIGGSDGIEDRTHLRFEIYQFITE